MSKPGHEQQPVIIIKKKGHGHGGHHGGAWKVAYADFVTAMMAFFLVMWLVGQSPKVKAGSRRLLPRSRRVRATKGRRRAARQREGLNRGGCHATEPDSVQAGAGDLEQAAEHLREALQKVPALEALEDQVEITVTAEGLRIELLENATNSFFDRGSAQLRPSKPWRCWA